MLLDTYAWVEFFNGTQKGLKVKELLENNACFTSAISLAELSEWIEKENLGRKQIMATVKSLSTIIEANQETMELAGMLKTQKRKTIKNFGLIDAIILATAITYSLKIVTGDQHFKKENSLML